MIMYKGILDCQEKLQAKYNIPIVIPSGTAVQNARWTPGLENGKDLTRDGYHLDKGYTRYLAACTWFETLSGESVVGNAWRPDNVTPEMADLCRKAAHDAFIHPYEVTR